MSPILCKYYAMDILDKKVSKLRQNWIELNWKNCWIYPTLIKLCTLYYWTYRVKLLLIFLFSINCLKPWGIYKNDAKEPIKQCGSVIFFNSQSPHFLENICSIRPKISSEANTFVHTGTRINKFWHEMADILVIEKTAIVIRK